MWKNNTERSFLKDQQQQKTKEAFWEKSLTSVCESMVTMRKMPHKSSIWKKREQWDDKWCLKSSIFILNDLPWKNFFASWLSCKFYHIFWETTLYKAVAGLKKDLSFPPDFPLLGMIHRLRQQRRVRDPIHLLWENHGFLRSHLRESRKWPRIWPVIFISKWISWNLPYSLIA